MNLYPIRTFVAANTDLTVARDLFTYSMPPQCKRGVLIVLNPAGNNPDHEIPGIFEARYQVIVRDTDFDTGNTRANEMFTLLTLLNEDLGDYLVEYSRPRNTPLPFPRSEGDLIEFSVNYDIRYKTS